MKELTQQLLLAPLRLVIILLVAFGFLTNTETRADDRTSIVAVTGQSDWSLLPPQIPSEYVTFHEDGGLTILDMPLRGLFHVSGEGVDIQAEGSGILTAILDPTLSGPIFGPLTVTQEVKGKDKVIFQGKFVGKVTGLLASGEIFLEGRGHFAGVTIVVSFLETGANTEVFDLTGYVLERN
jgi:hypothetical protein